MRHDVEAGKVTEAQRKGLEATARGEAVQIHNRTTFTITGPVAGIMLWTIFRAGLIAAPS